jgi:uncharacterized protein YxeA
MKKVLLILCSLILTISITVYAAGKNRMTIDIDAINFNINKNSDITSKFDNNYAIKYDDSSFKEGKDLENTMTILTKKTTYLLLGDPNKNVNDYKDYAKRKAELFDLRYAPNIPKDENGDLIETSPEYKDDIVTGINIPGMFKLLSEKSITYQHLGAIKVFKTNEYVITRTALDGVTIEWPNENEPLKIDKLETNLVLTYFYKQINNEYKLYWIMAETQDDVETYFSDIENAESNDNNLAMNSKNISEVSQFYDYSKLNALADSKIKKIYDDNVNRIVILNTYSDKSIINTGVGFFISDGIIATTWNYIEQSLLKGQFILIRDKFDNLYEMDGLVTINPDLDIAIIKLKTKIGSKVTLGDVSKMTSEDPVISISTKTGFGLTVVSGIMVSNDSTIKSLIPISSSDEGSPLFNSNGEVIGINTSKMVNSSLSVAMPSKYLSDLQSQFASTDFNSLTVVNFDKLKEQYYYKNHNKEMVANNIATNIWNKYKNIGNIDKTIVLPLLKASYYDGIVSLRYQNNIPSLIDNIKMSSSFRGKLIDDGYKMTSESPTKYIYENSKYKVIIMDQFNYLIILLARK